ncbi:MAG: RelA/SpoT domain-containing protein [Chitinophagales bacterium]|nr:RelA/SpoT domain-containing protein [Chitinophagales bacterium]
MTFEKEYSTIIDDYKDFLNEFKRIIEKILVRHNIPTAFGIYGRAKTLDSINEKIMSDRFEIKKSVTELNDLVGIRIVLLFPEFKEKVVEILSKEFKLLNDPYKSIQSPDKFGYSSIHLIIAIKDEWTKTPDWENHKNKKAEIQIRTLSEHIWAETSHSLFYKREENIPNILNRDLFRLSALLEVVDEKLQNLKDKIEEHFNFILEAPYEEILNQDLNSETFKRVMLQNSKGIYSLNDYKNKVLSSKIEKDYNILNVKFLDNLIANKIDLTDLDSDTYIRKVIEILDADKLNYDNKIEEKI